MEPVLEPVVPEPCMEPDVVPVADWSAVEGLEVSPSVEVAPDVPVLPPVVPVLCA